MKNQDKLVRVFTGSEMTVSLLKEELDELGVVAFVQNDFNSGISAGFSAGFPSSIDLYIQEKDVEKSAGLIKQFIDRNETDKK